MSTTAPVTISNLPPPVAAPPKQPKKKTSSSKKKSQQPWLNAPIFLRKTYTLIDTCDPSIASWADDGLTFLVKDTDKFASTVIPEYFKHSNFSSFVRQLNFYGFRKIKSDSIRIKDAESSEESKYWRFGHEKFQRGHPELLAEIRKHNQNDSVAEQKQEVDTLKAEVRDLKERLHSVTTEMEQFKNIVAGLTQQVQLMQQQYPSADLRTSNKKRKLPPPPSTPGTADPPSPVQSTKVIPQSEGSMEQQVPVAVTSDNGDHEMIVAEDQLSNVDAGMEAILATGSRPSSPMERVESGNLAYLPNFSAQDEEMLSSLFALDATDEITPASVGAPDDALSMIKPTGPSVVDPVLVDQLRDALAKLPEPMQKAYVERMVIMAADPDEYRKQICALTAIATAAAEKARAALAGTGMDPASTQGIQLAASILGAYLVRQSQETTPSTTTGAAAAMTAPIETLAMAPF